MYRRAGVLPPVEDDNRVRGATPVKRQHRPAEEVDVLFPRHPLAGPSQRVLGNLQDRILSNMIKTCSKETTRTIMVFPSVQLQRLLPHLEQAGVLEQGPLLRPHRLQVCRQNEGRGKDCPERQLGCRLLVRQSKVPHHDHVGVVPAARTAKLQEPVMVISIVISHPIRIRNWFVQRSIVAYFCTTSQLS